MKRWGTRRFRWMRSRNSANWIADALGISKKQAEDAVERLIKLGFLSYHTGRLACTEDFRDTPQDIPSQALKNFHRSLMDKIPTLLILHPQPGLLGASYCARRLFQQADLERQTIG